MNIARGTMTLVMLEPTRLTTYSEKPIPQHRTEAKREHQDKEHRRLIQKAADDACRHFRKFHCAPAQRVKDRDNAAHP